MKIREEIQELIKNVLEQSAVEIEGEIKVTHPDFLEHGDFTFNVLPFAKKSGVNPREFSEQNSASIENDLPKKTRR
jgi:arginyl-tRNA synthetase